MPYTEGDVLVRAVMTAKSGLVEDQVSNDFAFRVPGGPPDAADIDAMIGLVDGFYNGASGGFSVSKFIGENVDRAATHEIRLYHIGAGPLGSPFWTEPWLGPAAPATINSNLPLEVAVVLSFHADLFGVAEEAGASRPRARRRGRVYVGPLTTDALVITDDAPVISNALRTILGNRGNSLIDGSAAAGFAWCVWSREDAELRTVVGGWTDNAPDTQRRRGQASTSRITWG